MAERMDPEGHKEWKSNVYGQCKSWIDSGLQPRAVTRDLEWGVPVPVDGADGNVLYVGSTHQSVTFRQPKS
jgi:methionyl-tRNA synthetase